MKRPNILVVGSSNTDMIVRAVRIPRPGETILGGEFSVAAGGKGANQAVAAARAGGDVTFIARVGDDDFGKRAIAGFTRDRINVRYIRRDKQNPSGVALICVAVDGENSIAVASGANGKLSLADVKSAEPAFTRANILLTQLESPLATVIAAIRLATKHGVTVILNPAPARPLPASLLRQVSILTPNETEAEILTGVKVRTKANAAKAARKLHQLGVRTVIITLGARGVFCSTNSIQQRLPAFKVRVVDTTAAGDVFNGALAVALAERQNINDAIRFASAAAALSVTKLGAQPSAPRRAEIVQFLKSHRRRGGI